MTRIARKVGIAAISAVILLLSDLASMTHADEQKPRGFDLTGVLQGRYPDPATVSGVRLRITKAEVVERGENKLLQVHWEIKYSGKRWPLVILEPSLTRETSGQTDLQIIAKGKSGDAYSWILRSPKPFDGHGRRKYSTLDWFLEIEKARGVATGVLEAEFAEAKIEFLKNLPAEFSADVTPDMYLRMTHAPNDRAEHLHLDAWTGEVDSEVQKITIRKW